MPDLEQDFWVNFLQFLSFYFKRQFASEYAIL
jgi:hypothetical protein